MMNYASPMVDDRRRAPAPAPAEPFGERLQQIAIRTADIVIAVVALIVLAPLLALVALIVYLSDRGPVIFAHQRLGRDGRSFGCLKFRSMVTDAQERLRHLLETDAEARAEWARDHKLRNDPRITPIGRFIRKTSIDELPQLWNVIRGEMSIVGPRPIVEAERARYGRYFRHYAAVRPGLAGLWQVSGRNDVSYRRRVACDVLYARRYSLRTNTAIMVKTVPAVLLSRGTY